MATRVLTGSIALVVALFAILATPPFIAVLLGAVCIVGSIEVAKLTGVKTRRASAIAAGGFVLPLISDLVFLSLLLVFPQSIQFDVRLTFVFAAVLWLLGSYCIYVWKPNNTYVAYGSVLWLCGGALSAVYLHLQTTAEGSFAPNLLLLAIVPLWVGDSLAYFVGKAWGKHKMAPTISPNKTVEGGVANFVGCMGTAIAIGLWLDVPLVASIAVGLSTGILGQVGDLLQSRFKRRADVKDSGSILPGHGGILDRLDSFLFSSCPTMLLLLAFSPEMFHVKHWPF